MVKANILKKRNNLRYIEMHIAPTSIPSSVCGLSDVHKGLWCFKNAEDTQKHS